MFRITFTPREFQEKISQTCASNNCLVVLPTGLGKTKVAIQTIISRLNLYQDSKILFLTVTKPLAAQIQREICESTTIPNSQVTLFTGEVKPEKRGKMWNKSRIIVSTPQCIENDLINKNISLSDVSLLVLDEAHNAVRNYAYNWIAKEYNSQAQYPRVMGLTASPGSDSETIRQICENIYATEIEIRSRYDEDVKPYVQETNIEWIMVELPKPFLEIKQILEDSLGLRIGVLKSSGLVGPNQEKVGKKQLIVLQSSIQKKISSGLKDSRLWQGVSKTAEALKIYHALELVETQGIPQLEKYLKSMYESEEKTRSKAVKNLIKDSAIKSALVKAEKILEKGEIMEPKLLELKKLMETRFNSGKKAIIFTQYRDSALRIVSLLEKISGMKPKLFVGQMKKGETGLSQKQQAEVIRDFEEGKHNIIVATCVAEQGLDIPEVNLVIFHEPIPSAIRTIQRKGRTGRNSAGEIIILITKDTLDEVYHWTALRKEKKMYAEIDRLKKKIKLEKQETIHQYSSEKIMEANPPKTMEEKDGKEVKSRIISSISIQEEPIRIIADNREKSSKVIKYLMDSGVEVKSEQLESADYILSSNVAVELKTKQDFINSIIDGRLLSQLKPLRENFSVPLLILEGAEDIYSIRNVHPNAIRGMLSTIAVSYNIPILHTKNSRDTAELLKVIAEREQNPKNKDFSLRPEKKPATLREQQQYVIEGLPGIGPTLAKSLLRDFKSVKNIINAEDKHLQTTYKIGPKKVSEIKRVIDGEYEEK